MIVYKATNLKNGDFYIGLTKYPLETRMRGHKNNMNKYRGHFQDALIKYGWDNFKWEIIDTANNMDELKELEVKYIEQLKPRYNMTKGGDGNSRSLTLEDKRKLSEINKGKVMSEEAKNKISQANKGRKHSPEVRAKISKSKTGKKRIYPDLEKMKWLFGFAEQAATRSPDEQTKVGSILVNRTTGAVVALGFNGFVRGAPDHLLPKTRPEKYPYMVHAEINLIANCARHGISMSDCEMYCTLSPCISCMRTIWQCGINRIYVKTLYGDINTIKEMEDLKISIIKHGPYYVLEYSNV
jgi:dCMP deaminase